MHKKLFFILTIMLSLSAVAMAQDDNSNTSKSRTTTTTTTRKRTTTATTTKPATGATTATTTTPARGGGAAESASARAVRDAFDTLISGIRRADVGEVMGVYWNSPQLVLYNNNGTVTKSWDQVKSNRQSSYAKIKDVKLDISDDHVKMLGLGGAIVTARWKQTQTYDGKPETASGRMTVVFQNVGGQWKAVHVHTSPDRPDPSLLMPSERTSDPADTVTPPAKP